MSDGGNEPSGRRLDAQLHLLDRQVIDVHGVPITTVDDLELSDVPNAEELPTGNCGTCDHRAAQRTSARYPNVRWPTTKLPAASDAMGRRLRRRCDDHPGGRRRTLDVTWTERWVRDHIIGRIPGGRHDPD